MAEIKSTLDLVLERTKNLNISDEERKTLKRRETAGKIKGLVQKYLDGMLDLNAVIQELEANGSGSGTTREILAAECTERLDPAGGNGKIDELLKTFFSDRAAALLIMAEKWKKKAVEEERQAAADARKRWNEKQISGSALIPNIGKDPAWKSRYLKLVAEFRKEAAALLLQSGLSER